MSIKIPEQADQAFLVIKAALADLNAVNPELETRWILEKRANIDWTLPSPLGGQSLCAKQIQDIQNDLKRRACHEPITKIYGEAYFWDDKFYISKDTLDPRPETELIVELALARFKDTLPQTILDLGTGSGCLLLTLLKLFPEAKGVGIDISEAALDVAQKNARHLGLESRAQFLKSDWLDNISGKFDLIAANPPYVENQTLQILPESVRNFDPLMALDGGEDGLQAYKIIFSQIKSYMKPCGLGLFEIGWNQSENVSRLAEESGLQCIETHHDLAGLPRVVEISCGDK